MTPSMCHSSISLPHYPYHVASTLKVASCSKMAAGVPVIMHVFQAGSKRKVYLPAEKIIFKYKPFWKSYLMTLPSINHIVHSSFHENLGNKVFLTHSYFK